MAPVSPKQADPLWLVLVIVVPIIVIRRISQHTVVGGRTVLGAITAYLQIGVAYAALFQALSVWSSVPPFGTAAALQRVHLPQPDDDVDPRHR